jgi:hypothetical protein
VELTRRGFIAGAVATPVARSLPRIPAALWAPGTPLRHFTAHQGAVVEAATARLIPGPTDDLLEIGHPGAREANVVGYIDTLLASFDSDPPTIYGGGPFSGRAGGATDDFAAFQRLSPIQDRYWRAEVSALQATYANGIGALDAAADADFSAASALVQDTVLAADTSGFRDVLFDHAIEGWLAAPEYGGNRGQTGWAEVRFRGDTCPTGYTPAEVSQSDGLDPVDPTGVVAQLVALLGTVLDG